jgi:hypothetical protein
MNHYCTECCRVKKQPCKFHRRDTFEEDVALLANLSEPEQRAYREAARRRTAEAMARAAQEEGDDADIVGVPPVTRPRDDLIKAVVRAQGQEQLAQEHLRDPHPSDDEDELAVAQAALGTATAALVEDSDADAVKDAAAERSVYGLQAANWPDLDAGWLAEWRQERSKVFPHMKCCAFCGEVQLGGRNRSKFLVERPGLGASPYARCNSVMEPFTKDSAGDWWVCPCCQEPRTRSQRSRHSVAFEPDYVQLLIVPGIECLALQNLSLVDVSVGFYVKPHIYSHRYCIFHGWLKQSLYTVMRCRSPCLNNTAALPTEPSAQDHASALP